MTVDFWSSCFCFPSVGITRLCYHVQIPTNSTSVPNHRASFTPYRHFLCWERFLRQILDELLLVLHDPMTGSGTNVLSPVTSQVHSLGLHCDCTWQAQPSSEVQCNAHTLVCRGVGKSLKRVLTRRQEAESLFVQVCSLPMYLCAHTCTQYIFINTTLISTESRPVVSTNHRWEIFRKKCFLS